MKTRPLIMLLATALLTLAACQEEPPKPWIPVLEQVDYVALHDAVREARRHVDQASTEFKASSEDLGSKELEQARQSLFKLERYFLPMTEVRQLVYDADRIYFLGLKMDAQEKLRGAAAMLEKIGTTGGKSLAEAVGEVLVMIDDLERSVDSDPQRVAEKMRTLGEKVNLMLLKGELILAGVEFSSVK